MGFTRADSNQVRSIVRTVEQIVRHFLPAEEVRMRRLPSVGVSVRRELLATRSATRSWPGRRLRGCVHARTDQRGCSAPYLC
jgi:hypothetical protein